MHLMEFAENSIDVQHFSVIRGRMHIPWTSWTVPNMRVKHAADWHAEVDRPHIAHFINTASLTFGGRDVPHREAVADVSLVGPASVVMLRITVPDVGDVVIIQTNTPLEAPGEPLRLAVSFTWGSEKKVGRLLTSYIAGDWVSQWWQDVEIWENKVHLVRPKLVANDGPVGRLRKWYQQFYDDAEGA
jgi:hypothetical protein